MEGIDYRKLGLKCGIEIHQQVDSRKLFCGCVSEIREDEPNIKIKRKLRAVAGELGNIDPAALHEFLRDKEYIYEGYSDTNCLVEFDDEPPHPVNKDALAACVEVCMLLCARPVDEVNVMRKTVIDGSNTSGFQRTMLVGLDGRLETSEGIVNIPTICLEEDAARKISGDEKTTVFRLDRLGIPLIELGTAPDIKSPAHARETAEKLGMILRAAGRVKRGLGTIRQDLNVSIIGGERIEVKGVQDLRLISKVVEGEVSRQLMLLEIKNELCARDVLAEILKEDYIDITDLFRSSTSKVIRSSLDSGGIVLAVKMPGFSSLLKNRLGPELAQYARANAGVKGIFHSDELPAYGITEQEVSDVKGRLSVSGNDAFVLVAEKKDTAKKALDAVVQRAKVALIGIPKETRRALPDGRSEFMRPLPGSARMYPETDEPLIPLTKEYLAKIKSRKIEMPEEKIERLIKMGLGPELAGQMAKSTSMQFFEELVERFSGLKPSVIATTLISTPKEAKKKYDVEVDLDEEQLEKIFSILDKKLIAKEALPELMAECARHPEKSIEDLIKSKHMGMLSEAELKGTVDRFIDENKELVCSNIEKAKALIFGRVMSEVRGKADAETVRNLVEGRLRQV